MLPRVITLAIPLFHGRRGDIERSRPVPAHVSAERLPRGEHHAAGVAPVNVAGGGALAGPRAEQEVEAVGVHPRALVAGAVASQRLERGERAAAGAAPSSRVALQPPPCPCCLGITLLAGDSVRNSRSKLVASGVGRAVVVTMNGSSI